METSLSNLLSIARPVKEGRVLLLRPRRSEALVSVFFAFIATGLIVLVYNLDPFLNWTLLAGVWAGSEAVILYLLQNQRQNEKKFQRTSSKLSQPRGRRDTRRIREPSLAERAGRNRPTIPKQENEEAQERGLGRGLARDQEGSRPR